MIGLDVLGFAIAVVTAVAGAAMSIAANAPSRSRLLKDIEILERMSAFKTTSEEDAHLLMLRASVGRRVKKLAMPVRRYAVLSIAVMILFVIAICAVAYNIIPKEAVLSPLFVFLAPVLSLIIGYGCGTVSANIAIKIIESRLEQTRDFLDSVLGEVNDWMPERGKHRARHDEPAEEDSDVCEEVVHE